VVDGRVGVAQVVQTGGGGGVLAVGGEGSDVIVEVVVLRGCAETRKLIYNIKIKLVRIFIYYV